MDLETIKDMFRQYLELLRSKNLVFEEIKAEKLPLDKLIYYNDKLYFCYLYNIDEATDNDKVSLIHKHLTKILETYRKANKSWIPY